MVALREHLLRFIRVSLLLACFGGFFVAPARAGLLDFNLGEGLPEKVEKGNEAFRNQKWDEALKIYSDALVDGPDSELLQANMGKVLYKQGRFGEARQSFEKLLSSPDRRLRARAHYDLGNALYRLATGTEGSGSSFPSSSPSSPSSPSAAAPPDPTKLLQSSLESYIEGLKLDPEDEDAKYNVEYIRRKIKEQQQKQQQKQDQQKQDQQKQDQQKQDQQKQDQQKQDQQKQDQQKQDQQKQDQQKQDQQKQDQQKQDEQKQDEQKQDRQKQDQQKQDQQQDQQKQDRASRPEDEKAIPKEQALKKLDELREHEKRELERQMERRAGQRGGVEYDW